MIRLNRFRFEVLPVLPVLFAVYALCVPPKVTETLCANLMKLTMIGRRIDVRGKGRGHCALRNFLLMRWFVRPYWQCVGPDDKQKWLLLQSRGGKGQGLWGIRLGLSGGRDNVAIRYMFMNYIYQLWLTLDYSGVLFTSLYSETLLRHLTRYVARINFPGHWHQLYSLL